MREIGGEAMSMTRVLLLLFGCFLLFSGAEALADTGNEYLQWDERSRISYVRGVVDAWQHIRRTGEWNRNPDMLPPFFKGVLVCMEQHGWTVGQTVDIAEKYLRDHPEERHLRMASLVWGALWKACGQPK